ncbi:hypothetical protein HH310_05810 [Actinoplanes sp. TBRC 11911]|uniref:hypothetical protein n=1 Tax=Actinoplanes sp. TBRC 11911 TaxID=2729386 RepID=UPI00145EBBAB|nr:hypothetical protein [Actinoplanes sp. TBRC 11911]NMO50709.1 hypothetical protein [Actinoplanes sp. TBRC 11911]
MNKSRRIGAVIALATATIGMISASAIAPATADARGPEPVSAWLRPVRAHTDTWIDISWRTRQRICDASVKYYSQDVDIDYRGGKRRSATFSRGVSLAPGRVDYTTIQVNPDVDRSTLAKLRAVITYNTCGRKARLSSRSFTLTLPVQQRQDRPGRPGRGDDDDNGRPGNDNGRPGNDNGRPGNDNGRPGNDNGRPGNDSDNGRPGNDNGRPGNDNGRPGNDNGRPGNDNGRPGNDSDNGRPGNDNDNDRHGNDNDRHGNDNGRPGSNNRPAPTATPTATPTTTAPTTTPAVVTPTTTAPTPTTSLTVAPPAQQDGDHQRGDRNRR